MVQVAGGGLLWHWNKEAGATIPKMCGGQRGLCVINKFYLLCVIFSGSPDLTLKTCLVYHISILIDCTYNGDEPPKDNKSILTSTVTIDFREHIAASNLRVSRHIIQLVCILKFFPLTCNIFVWTDMYLYEQTYICMNRHIFIWTDMYLVIHGSLSQHESFTPRWLYISVVLVLLLLFCDSPHYCGCRNQVPPQVPDNGHVQTFVPFGHIYI